MLKREFDAWQADNQPFLGQVEEKLGATIQFFKGADAAGVMKDGAVFLSAHSVDVLDAFRCGFFNGLSCAGRP